MSSRLDRQNDLVRLADLMGEPGGSVEAPQRRLANVWREALGEEIARNSQPRYLRAGRLVAATSSSVWAQTLQLMADELIRRLNGALGEELVRQAVFRPAGWDPGGGVGSPRALDQSWNACEPGTREWVATEVTSDRGTRSDRRPPAGRRLTDEEEAAVQEVGSTACDEDLGRLIAAAMRAALSRDSG